MRALVSLHVWLFWALAVVGYGLWQEQSAWTPDALDRALKVWEDEWTAAAAELTKSEFSQEDNSPSQDHAAKFLDCEGLGEAHNFWVHFRETFSRRGPLDSETIGLAVMKWQEWESFIDALDVGGKLNGQITVPLLDNVFENRSAVQVLIYDRQDVLRALQQARYQALFGSPRAWGSGFVGALACPIGFLLVQYVLFVVQRVRFELFPEEVEVSEFGFVLRVCGGVSFRLRAIAGGSKNSDEL
mmetsp:Transcript_11654/g.31256  ORF Transcript_11654/g.31256 Transcript_11654/m.31256 type:complete len:243 (-) Transcript_11654:16-744(-)